jgi:hypothetical protein
MSVLSLTNSHYRCNIFKVKDSQSQMNQHIITNHILPITYTRRKVTIIDTERGKIDELSAL